VKGMEGRDIVAGYGKIEVLHGASVRAGQGEIVCIIGPNGSGKSTLLNSLFGLIVPREGAVLRAILHGIFAMPNEGRRPLP
jgi:ABC-type branched-subunit amino acid transport system ATPase component